MPDDEEGLEGLTQVPPWVLRVVRDLAETKKGVGTLENGMIALSLKVETFLTRGEYAERHKELVDTVAELRDKRINPLWDAHNQLLGKVDTERRATTRWRWAFGAAIGLLAAWAALHTAHVSLSI